MVVSLEWEEHSPVFLWNIVSVYILQNELMKKNSKSYGCLYTSQIKKLKVK